MPLNEASCAVVVICDRIPLNWLTRLLRTVCAAASTTGAVGVVKVIAAVSVPPIAPPDATEPRVDEANSLVVVIVSLPVESTVAARLLASSAALSWSSVLTVPLEPSPKVTLTAVPPLKEVKVKVLPERLPGAAVRPAVKVVPVPVLPVRPSDESALPVPTIDRSALVPVEICSAPLELIEDAVCPLAVANVAP